MVAGWLPGRCQCCLRPALRLRSLLFDRENLRDQLTEAQRTTLVGQLAALTPEQPVWIEQKSALTPLGKQTWQEWLTRGFFDGFGILVELQSVGRDITLRKEMSLGDG